MQRCDRACLGAQRPSGAGRDFSCGSTPAAAAAGGGRRAHQRALAPMAALAGSRDRDRSSPLLGPMAAFSETSPPAPSGPSKRWRDLRRRPHRRGTLTHDPSWTSCAGGRAESPAFYIGSLGSTRNHSSRVARLTELGWVIGVGAFTRRSPDLRTFACRDRRGHAAQIVLERYRSPIVTGHVAASGCAARASIGWRIQQAAVRDRGVRYRAREAPALDSRCAQCGRTGHQAERIEARLPSGRGTSCAIGHRAALRVRCGAGPELPVESTRSDSAGRHALGRRAHRSSIAAFDPDDPAIVARCADVAAPSLCRAGSFGPCQLGGDAVCARAAGKIRLRSAHVTWGYRCHFADVDTPAELDLAQRK